MKDFNKYLQLLLVGLLFLVVQLGLQYANGSFSNEFGESPDEAGHFITGLMVRDYLAGFQFNSPMSFAEDYYLHYPKVALGHWPPFFYVVQAAWTLVFSPSRLSLILLMAMLTTFLAFTVFMTTKKKVGFPAGVGAGLLLIALPLVQKYSSMVMAEILVALLCFWAVLCFSRFLDTEKWQWTVGFASCAVLAIMTKGNALVLIFVPPIALFLSKRFYLFTRMTFWIPAGLVLVLCGHWYWWTWDMVVNGMFAESPKSSFTVAAIPYYSYEMVKFAGIGLSILVAIGFYKKIIVPYRKGGANGEWSVVGAFLLSVWAFHFIVPAGLDSRHLITAVPALLLFLAAGIFSLIDKLPQRLTHGQKRIILSLSVLLVFALETFSIPGKAWDGFSDVAQRLLRTPDYNHSVILISSDPRGEGMFISEVAMREKRPGHIVLRASKVLAKSWWSGKDYKVIYSTPKQIMAYLEKLPVGVVVVDQSVPEIYNSAHHRLLQKTVERYDQHWKFLGAYPVTRNSILYKDAIKVYGLIGQEKRRVSTIRVNMHKMLGKNIEKHF